MIWKLFVISLTILGCSARFASQHSYNDGPPNDYGQDRHQCPEAAYLSQLFVTLAETFNNMAQQIVRSPQMLNSPNNHHIGRHGGHHGYLGQRGHHVGYGYHHQPHPHKPFNRAPPPPVGPFFGAPPPPVGPFFGGPPPPGGPFYGGPFHGPPPPFVVEAQTPFLDGPWTSLQGRNPFRKNPNPPANPPPFSNPSANLPTFSSPPTFSNSPASPPASAKPPMFSQTPQFPGSSSIFSQLPNNGNNNRRTGSPSIGLSKPITSQLQPPLQPQQSQPMPEPQTKDNGLGLDDQSKQENSKDILSDNDLSQKESLDSDFAGGLEAAQNIGQQTEDTYSPNSGDTGDLSKPEWNELLYSIFADDFTPTSTISSADIEEDHFVENDGQEDQQD